MAKRIQQSTFDDVVKENMTEFDMDIDDSIIDAIKQFESQGVNLDNIVRDANIYKNKDELNTEQHFIVSTVMTLGEVIDDEEPQFDVITPALQTIKNECSKDLARRCLAGRHGAYNVLLKCLEKCHLTDNVDVLTICLETFCSFCDGQPDHLTESGAVLMMRVLDDYFCHSAVVERAIKLLCLNCVKHEANRVLLYDKGIASRLVSCTELKDDGVLMEACRMLRILTYDDDVRVPFGKGLDHAKNMVTDHNLLFILCRLIKEHQTDDTILNELLLTLCKLTVRDDICKQVYETGILNIFIQSIHEFIDNVFLVKSACLLLKALAGNDKVKTEIVSHGGAEALYAVFDKYQGNASVCEACCALVSALALRNPRQSMLMVDINLHRMVIQAMKIHANCVGLQKCACMAIRNLVSHCKDIAPLILELGAEEVLNSALKNHENMYEAKSALRDLECHVHFDELWTGSKGELTQ